MKRLICVLFVVFGLFVGIAHADDTTITVNPVTSAILDNLSSDDNSTVSFSTSSENTTDSRSAIVTDTTDGSYATASFVGESESGAGLWLTVNTFSPALSLFSVSPLTINNNSAEVVFEGGGLLLLETANFVPSAPNGIVEEELDNLTAPIVGDTLYFDNVLDGTMNNPINIVGSIGELLLTSDAPLSPVNIGAGVYNSNGNLVGVILDVDQDNCTTFITPLI